MLALSEKRIIFASGIQTEKQSVKQQNQLTKTKEENKMKKTILFSIMALSALIMPQESHACTGITLHTTTGLPVTARTIEWAGNDLESRYSIVPQGYRQQSYLPDGTKGGLAFQAKYGYVGLAVQQAEFVVEGINEAGLAAGLFYFPDYGEYEKYDAAKKDRTISDLQLVSYILGKCRTVDEVKEAVKDLHVVTIDPRGSTVHWRFTEEGGRQIVLEIIGKKPHFYENTLGVLTNSPSFDWHLTNLNNYVNLQTGRIDKTKIGNMSLHSFGGGSGLHGIPGDMTPPSRFVRAAFFQSSAPRLDNTEKTIEQAFHILNNFDIPVGIQFAEGQEVPDIPSATQWTVATDLKHRCIYYRTMHNANIRYFNLKEINFKKVKFQSFPLDLKKSQAMERIKVE